MTTPTPLERADALMDSDALPKPPRADGSPFDWRIFPPAVKFRDAIASAIAEAERVAAAREREACAVVADWSVKSQDEKLMAQAALIAARIRARTEDPAHD